MVAAVYDPRSALNCDLPIYGPRTGSDSEVTKPAGKREQLRDPEQGLFGNSLIVESGTAEASRSTTATKAATVRLDTDLAGNQDAFNPAELLLGAISACVIKGIERVTPMMKFQLRGVEVRIHGVRQDVPPRLESITYEIVVDTDEPDRRLELLHENVKKYGTVFNTVAPGTAMEGVLRRAGILNPSRPGPPHDA